MSKWSLRAKQHFSESLPTCTPITPKRVDVGVLGVPLPHAMEIPPIERLMYAALQVCERFGDGPAAIEEMKAQVQEIPVELRADLLAHFNRTYSTGGRK